jgi:hypothetical protein
MSRGSIKTLKPLSISEAKLVMGGYTCRCELSDYNHRDTVVYTWQECNNKCCNFVQGVPISWELLEYSSFGPDSFSGNCPYPIGNRITLVGVAGVQNFKQMLQR